MLNGLRQGRALMAVQERQLARSLAVDQPIGTARVEPHHPAAHDLHRDAAEPCSISARAAIIDRCKRQEPPRLVGILLSVGPESAARLRQSLIAKKLLNPLQTSCLRYRFRFVGFWEPRESVSMKVGISGPVFNVGLGAAGRSASDGGCRA